MITCTITPPPDCLARLAACPALPRGERLEWARSLPSFYRDNEPDWGSRGGLWTSHCLPAVADDGPLNPFARWRSMARPLRVARERLREARNAIETVAMAMDDASYLKEDSPHVRAMKKAMHDLYASLELP